MKITFKQTLIKGVLKRAFVEETIKNNVIPNVGDHIKIGNIDGRVDYRIINYNSNDMTILLYPRDAIDVN